MSVQARTIDDLVSTLRRLVSDEVSKTIDAAHKNRTPLPDVDDQRMMAGSVALRPNRMATASNKKGSPSA